MILWVSVLKLLVFHALLLLCISLRHEARRDANYPHYRQIGQRARRSHIASARLSVHQNGPYAPYHTQYARSTWHGPWRMKPPIKAII